MPEKITNIANVSVGVIYVIGGLSTLFFLIGAIISSYAFFVAKTVNRKIDELKESTKDHIRDDQTIHTDLFDKTNDNTNKIGKVETDLSNLRREHDKNHRG